MIVSMTGYGEVDRVVDGVEYALGLRSVNNRYFKATIKLPEGMQFAEAEVEKLVRGQLTRGSLVVNVRMRNATASAAYDVNHEALSRYAASLAKVALPHGVHATVDLAMLSSLPGVCQVPEVDEEHRLAQLRVISEMTRECLERLLTMRRREGQALHDDLIEQCTRLRTELDTVATRAPTVLVEYRDRLTTRVEALLSQQKFELQADSLNREVALYADRCDISEEITRLRAHVDHFMEICDAGDAVGRKLDFLAQEMLREANTIGSKSGDALIARSVIEMKTLIDRIKEQVQNVE